MQSRYLIHSKKGTTWKEHKYIKKADGVYYYPSNYEGGRHLDGEAGESSNLEEWEKQIHKHVESIVEQHPEMFDTVDKVYAALSNPANLEAFRGTLKAITGKDNIPDAELKKMQQKIASYYDYGGSSGKGSANGSSKKEKTSSKKASSSTYKEYTEGDSDFDDSNYSDKNRIGDSEFHAFTKKSGETVILEEDMKWTLPKGQKLTDNMKKDLQKVAKKKHKSHDEFVSDVNKVLKQADMPTKYLIHHQRKGAKWGILNGPPYPLGSNIVKGYKARQERMADKKHQKELDRAARDIGKAAKKGREVDRSSNNILNNGKELSNIGRSGDTIGNKSAGILRRSADKDKQKAMKAMDVSKMSDKELRQIVNRAKLEQSYKDLQTKDIASGKRYAADILQTAGDVLAIAGSIAGIASAIYTMRKGK